MLKVHDTTHHSITTDGYQSKHSFSTSGSPSTVVTEQSARLASEEPAARQTGYAQKPLSKAVSDPPVGRERPGSAGMWDWKHQEEQLLPCNPCDPDVPYNGGASLWGDKEDGPAPFRLTTTFVDKYKTVQPPFGFNGLGEFVYQTRYSRYVGSRLCMCRLAGLACPGLLANSVTLPLNGCLTLTLFTPQSTSRRQ